MPSHINDHSPEVQVQRSLAELHAKHDALAEKVDALLETIRGRSEKPAEKSKEAS